MYSLQQGLRHTIALEQYRPQCQSIFPKLQSRLGEEQNQAVINWLSGGEHDYRGDVDFFYTWCFPSYEVSCREYYADKGPLLKDLLTLEERKTMSELLHRMLSQLGNSYRSGDLLKCEYVTSQVNCFRKQFITPFIKPYYRRER